MSKINCGVRYASGIPALDRALGGGLLPGTMALIVGATGIGKTQLGIRWCAEGCSSTEPFGTILDFSSRGDSQNHVEYANSIVGNDLTSEPLRTYSPDEVFDRTRQLGQRMELVGYEGQRVLRSQVDAENWDAWNSLWNARAPMLASFIYQCLIRGRRRFLIDGIEPSSKPQESLQWDMVEMVYHKMLRRSHDWLARDVFRQHFRVNEAHVAANPYSETEATAVVLATSHESMLEQLIEKSWTDGDLAAGANTVIFMGRIKRDGGMGRGLFIAKHRGSYCSDAILEYSINSNGIQC